MTESRLKDMEIDTWIRLESGAQGTGSGAIEFPPDLLL